MRKICKLVAALDKQHTNAVFRKCEGDGGNTNPDPADPLFFSVAFVCFCLSRVRCAGSARYLFSSGSKGNYAVYW